jgi:2-iminobutanoate/2-iminopropanoate deaminase
MTNVLEAAGSCKENVLKVHVYVSNLDDLPVLNKAYNSFFAEPRPARCTVQVAALDSGTDVEMECTAFIAKSKL